VNAVSLKEKKADINSKPTKIIIETKTKLGISVNDVNAILGSGFIFSYYT
jgi:hypothetical protein